MISVLRVPLFTAVYSDESTRKVGLMELLTEAHSIEDIKANSCTGKVALLRFCIAFVSDAYCPESVEDRAELLEEGRFDADLLASYVAECEKKGVSFDLDDEKCPFMQAAFDGKLDDKAEKPVAKIMFDVPSGNNHIHTDHRLENMHAIDIQAAFEAMLETYLFCPAGLSGASNVNNTPPVYVVLHGDNLFETLVLNMVSEEEIGSIPYGKGEVAWKRKDFVEPGRKVVEMSLLKALTWQPRRLLLQLNDGGMVKKVYVQNGLNFQGNELWMDPHVPYRKTKDGRMASVKPDIGRELWRDAGTVVLSGPNTRCPIPLMNVSSVWLNRPETMDIELAGMITNNEAILGRAYERLCLPKVLFEDYKMADWFCLALELVDRMYRTLQSATIRYFCHPDDKKKKSMLAEQAGEVYLHVMRNVLFGSFLRELLAGIKSGDMMTHFMDAMWSAVDREALGHVIEQAGFDIQSLKLQNSVRAEVKKGYNALRKEVLG